MFSRGETAIVMGNIQGWGNMSIGITSFGAAITRQPASSAVDGLRAEDHGTPDVAQMLKDHADYCAALSATGATVITLPPLAGFPDAQFVEDTALCLPEGVIFMSPGAPSRRGEVAAIEAEIGHHFASTHHIEAPAFIEGGDILVTATEILVGLSARTTDAGIAALTAITSPWGYNVRRVDTPADVLHFKTDCSLLDDRTILTTRRLAASGCFDGYELVYTADGEEAAANTIRFNDKVIMPAGFPKTEQLLSDAGYNVLLINNSECEKIDGGMSCLSLRLAHGAD